MRPYLFLAAGLIVGVAGAILFRESMPGEPGSAESRVQTLEVELRRAQNRIATLEAANPDARKGPGGTLMDRARNIAQDIRDGRRVDLDDVFQAVKPLLRDLAPIFDRIRIRDQRRHADARIGELTRKYHLDAAGQQALKNWFEKKAEAESAKFNELVGRDSTTLEDMMLATRNERPDEGLDTFMETVLSGDDSKAYRQDRMQQRLEYVQQEADRKVQRLDAITPLDEDQKDKVFALMARGSRDFDPSMQLDGLGSDTSALVPGQSRDAAIIEVLRPDQRAAYETRRAERRAEAERDLQELGLSLPAAWDVLEQDDF